MFHFYRSEKQSMAYTVGTCMNVKKMLPRSSSPVLTTQGASSRVLKGTAGNITVYLYLLVY